MSGPRIHAFRRRLLDGEPLLGTFVKTPSPVVCEVLSATPLDALCLDAEHAPFGRVEMDTCLAVTLLSDMPTLVRVPSAAPPAILNALDCGAGGVVIPHVRSAEEAARAAAACRFGRGGRGYAGSTRAAGFGAKAIGDHLRDSAERTAVIAQIEDVEAVEAIDDIAGVEGIDCLFIGRIDLTVALAAAGPDAPEVVEAVETVCASASRAGRRVGMFVSDPAEVPGWQKRGASLFLLSSDHGFLKSGAAALARRFRNGTEP